MLKRLLFYSRQKRYKADYIYNSPDMISRFSECISLSLTKQSGGDDVGEK